MNLIKYIMLRGVALVAQIVGAVAVIIFATSLIPYDISVFFTIGDVSEDGVIGQETRTQEDIEQFKQELGLDKSPFERFYDFIVKMFTQGDLGYSWYGDNTSVTELYFNSFLVTLKYFGLGILIFTLLAIILGILAAKDLEGALDRNIRFGTSIFYSFPPFVLGTLLIYLFGNIMLPRLKNKLYDFIYTELEVNISRKPLIEIYDDFFDTLIDQTLNSILPVVCVVLIFTGFQFRLVRIYMSEVLNQNYIRTAYAKGLGEREILLKHGLKNAIPELITSVATTFPIAFSGVVVLEKVFEIPGSGLLLIDSGLIFDWPVLIGGAIIFTALNAFILMLSDLSINIIDPRLRLK